MEIAAKLDSLMSCPSHHWVAELERIIVDPKPPPD
jgi:hypothetical protein